MMDVGMEVPAASPGWDPDRPKSVFKCKNWFASTVCTARTT